MTPRLFVLAATSMLLFSCSAPAVKTSLEPNATAGLNQTAYAAALADAAIVTPEKIKPLLPIPTESNIQVVSWVTDSRIPCNGKPTCDYTTGNYVVWVTQAGEVQKKCQSWKLQGAQLRERLEALLGLPHNSPVAYQKTHFVVMSVPTAQITRPCLGLDQQNGQPVCTLTANNQVSANQQAFVMQQMASSYVDNNPAGPGYPFTRLGYTYDWFYPVGASSHYGASEFLLAANSPVNVLRIETTDNYCAAVNP